MPTATLTPTVWTTAAGAAWQVSPPGAAAAVGYDGGTGHLRATGFTGLPAGAAVSRLTVRVRRRAAAVKLVDAVLQVWTGAGQVGPNAAAGAAIPATAADLTLTLTDPADIAAALAPGGGVVYAAIDGTVEPPFGGEVPAGGGDVVVVRVEADAEYV
jgi:hypothetical protein